MGRKSKPHKSGSDTDSYIEVSSSDDITITNDNSDVLNDILQQLSEKSKNTRIHALQQLTKLLQSQYIYDNLINTLETITLNIVNSIKKGDQNEITTACHTLSCFIITMGIDQKAANYIFNSCNTLLIDYIRNTSKSTIIRSACCDTLSIINWIGAESSQQIQPSINMLRDILTDAARTVRDNINKSISNDIQQKQSLFISHVIDAFSLLCTTQTTESQGHTLLNQNYEIIKYLLQHDSVDVKISIAELFALLHSKYNEFHANDDSSNNNDDIDNMNVDHIIARTRRLSVKPDAEEKADESEIDEMIQMIIDLSNESNRYINKTDRLTQRITLRDIVNTLEDNNQQPTQSITVDKQTYEFVGYSDMIQLNVLRNILSSGLSVHIKSNPLLQQLFDFGNDDDENDDDSIEALDRKAMFKARAKKQFIRINAQRKLKVKKQQTHDE